MPTIRLLEQIGVKPVIDVARRAGIRSPLPNDLTLALGSGDVTLLELTAAYGTFANQGVHMEPLMVRYVTDAQGRLVEENIPQGREAIEPAIADRRSPRCSAASSSAARPSARGSSSGRWRARPARPTTSRTPGSWATRRRSWPGSGSATIAPGASGNEETGARAALPIWVSIMRTALRDQPVEDFPAVPAATTGRRSRAALTARRRAQPRGSGVRVRARKRGARSGAPISAAR